MKNVTTYNYYDCIKAILPSHEFELVQDKLRNDSNEQLEAFWNIIVAGYPVDFTLANYKKLYAFLQDKPINYSEALVTYATYPGLPSGIYITKTQWFELN